MNKHSIILSLAFPVALTAQADQSLTFSGNEFAFVPGPIPNATTETMTATALVQLARAPTIGSATILCFEETVTDQKIPLALEVDSAGRLIFVAENVADSDVRRPSSSDIVSGNFVTVPTGQSARVSIVMSVTPGLGGVVRLSVDNQSAEYPLFGNTAVLAQPTAGLGIGSRIVAGMPATASSGATFFFIGEIDEVTLWRRALSDTEIQRAQSRTLSYDTHGLIGYWRFNEPAGQFVADCSPSGANGVLGGSAATTTQDPTRGISSLSTPAASKSLGFATTFNAPGGMQRTPQLALQAGAASPIPGLPVALALSNAPAGNPVILHFGTTGAGYAVRSFGVLVPHAPVSAMVGATDANGALSIPFVWPTGVPCLELTFQAEIGGTTTELSNGLLVQQVTTP